MVRILGNRVCITKNCLFEALLEFESRNEDEPSVQSPHLLYLPPSYLNRLASQRAGWLAGQAVCPLSQLGEWRCSHPRHSNFNE